MRFTSCLNCPDISYIACQHRQTDALPDHWTGKQQACSRQRCHDHVRQVKAPNPERAQIRRLATKHQRNAPNTLPPQPTVALHHLRASRGYRLLCLCQSAHQPRGFWPRLDESSVAGHRYPPLWTADRDTSLIDEYGFGSRCNLDHGKARSGHRPDIGYRDRNCSFMHAPVFISCCAGTKPKDWRLRGAGPSFAYVLLSSGAHSLLETGAAVPDEGGIRCNPAHGRHATLEGD